MNEEITSKLREHELKRMSAQYYCGRREQEMGKELARLRTLSYDELPCDEGEKKALYNIAKERLEKFEEEIPAFKNYCKRMCEKTWPQNLYEEIFGKPLLVKEGAEERVKNKLNSFTHRERECLLMLFCERKNCDEICEELQIYPTELEEHVTWGLRRLRHPRYSRNLERYVVLLEGDTPFSEVAAACKSEDELLYALEQVPIETPQRRIPASLQSEALALVCKHPEETITTAFLQKNLKIAYPEAAALKRFLDVDTEGA